jgi:Domain of unknown function (DUF4377)
MMRRAKTLLLGLLLTPLACMEPYSAREELELVVLESLTTCYDFVDRTFPCLNVIELPGKEPRAFYANIEGFRFIQGTRQRIRVVRYTLNDPPMDSGSYEYHLVRVVSKELIYIVVDMPDL